MAEGFKFKASKSGSRKSSGSGNKNALINYILSQEKGSGLQEQLGSEAIPVGGTDPSTGGRFETQEGVNLDVEKTGRNKAVTDAVTAIGNLKKMLPIITEFEKEFDRVFPNASSQQGFPGKLEASKVLFKGDILENDPKLSASIDSLEGKRSQIAKGLGEVGNLAEQEQKIAMGNVPNMKLGDPKNMFLAESPAKSKVKLSSFQKFINDQISQNKQIIESYGDLSSVGNPPQQEPPAEDLVAKKDAIKARFKQRNP